MKKLFVILCALIMLCGCNSFELDKFESAIDTTNINQTVTEIEKDEALEPEKEEIIKEAESEKEEKIEEVKPEKEYDKEIELEDEKEEIIDEVNSENEIEAEQEVEKEIDFTEIRNRELSNIPNYSKEPYVAINNNVPFFNDDDLTVTSYEQYGDLDYLNRCTSAIACIGMDIMPTEERGNIGNVKPSGWHTVRYNGIDGNYLYNRCHLVGYQLTGENANIKNLITGTRYMNVEGMLPFENMIADYVKETNNHVLYRVTPIFKGNNLLASGVLIEAKSLEDQGKGIELNVYCYNVQPGIKIDYNTGESEGPEYTGNINVNSNNESSSSSNEIKKESSEIIENTYSKEELFTEEKENTYILNTNTKKFHESWCSSVKKMSEKNKKIYTGERSNVTSQGYIPCKICNP